MSRSLVTRRLATYGGRAVWRQGVVTDNGNHILDVHGLTIPAPASVARPGCPASATTTSARPARWYAVAAPPIPLPITSTRMRHIVASTGA